jgi:Helix-turn-helix family
MRDRGLIGDDGWLSESGRAVKRRVEALTDDLAARPYEILEPDELAELRPSSSHSPRCSSLPRTKAPRSRM